MKKNSSTSTPRELIEEYLEGADISDRTRETYGYFLNFLADHLKAEEIDPAKMTKIELRTFLAKRDWSSSTRRLAHISTRQFLKFAYGKSHPALSLLVKSVRPGPQRTLTAEQVRTLIECQDISKPNGLRNTAMLMLMLDTGLRAAEVCRLSLDFLNLDDCTLSVKIKGGSVGTGVFSPDTAFWLRSWIDTRKQHARPGVRNVFIGIGGFTPGAPITRDGMRAIFRRMGKAAGLGLISPHDLRRTFACLLLENGASTRLVQLAGRWANIQEVERYSRQLEARRITPFLAVTSLWAK